MTVSIDASVALKWFMEESKSHLARCILDGNEPLAAPDLIIAEVCNAAWKTVRRNLMTAVQADAMAYQLPVCSKSCIRPQVWRRQRCTWRATSTTRCFYLAIAEQRDTRVGTAWETRVRALADIGASVDQRMVAGHRAGVGTDIPRNLLSAMT